MKTCYVDKTHRAIADLMPFEEGMMLTRINVPRGSRGQGVGSRLLQQVLDDARQEGIPLYLMINPSDGLSYVQLERWYTRRGFVQRSDGIFQKGTK